jgi:excisionase family DNA binding protein
MTDGKIFNVDDAASLLGGVSPWTLRKHIANGTIRITRIGRRVLLLAEEVERIRQEGLPSLRPASLRLPDSNARSKQLKSSHFGEQNVRNNTK